MKINKLGQSTNLILLVGVLITTVVSVFAVYTTFDDIVRDMIEGDPEIAAKQIAANMDIAVSAPNEITIYAETPIHTLGYPIYGTVLLNAEDKKIRVHSYTQVLMKDQLQKSMYGEVSAEDVGKLYVLWKFRNSKWVMQAGEKYAKGAASKIFIKEAEEQIAARTAAGAAPARVFPTGAKQAKFEKMANNLNKKIMKKQKDGIFKKGARAVKSGVAAIGTKLATKKATTKVSSKAGSKALRVASAKAARKGVAKGAAKVAISAGSHATTSVYFQATFAAAQADISQVTRFTRLMVYSGIWGVNWYLTFWPMNHAILNARDARNQLADGFGEFEFHTGDTKIYVAKPNCESKRYSMSPGVDIPYIPEWIGLEQMLGSTFNLPMSESTNDLKKYKSITNEGTECYDAHNIYLNQDGSMFYRLLGATTGRIEGTGSTAVSDGHIAGIKNPITHPWTWAVAAPTALCNAQLALDPMFASSCYLAYELVVLGAWSNNELLDSAEGVTGPDNYEEALDYWSGNLWLDGIVGVISIFGKNPFLFPVFYTVNHLAPVDSSTLFAYITGSPSLIDSQKEYYMEDPLIITITKKKDEQTGEYILLIDKEA